PRTRPRPRGGCQAMNLMPEKIKLPDVSDEQREAVEEILTEAEEHAARIQRQQVGVVVAMMRLKKPMARRGFPKRKRSKVSKHVAHMRRLALRSQRVIPEIDEVAA